MFTAPLRDIVFLKVQGERFGFQQSQNKHPLQELSLLGPISHVWEGFGKPL